MIDPQMGNRPKRRRKRPLPPQGQYVLAQPPYPFPVPQAPQVPASPPVASVFTLSAKNATVARVQVSKTSDWSKGPDYQFTAADSAKREQGDRYDPETGELIAIGRAFLDIGEQMVREGNKRVTDLVEEQAQERERAAQRRENKVKPVRRRTREEWEEIQRRREQHERNAQMARNLGLDVEPFQPRTPDEVPDSSYEYGTVASVNPANYNPRAVHRVKVQGDRWLEIENDRVIIRSALTGAIAMTIDRA
jgi:hypothetical protein